MALDFDAGCVAAADVVVTFAVVTDELQEWDCHCGSGTVAFVVGIPNSMQKTFVTSVTGAVAVVVVAVPCFLLSKLAAPAVSVLVASAVPDVVASSSRV